MHKYIFSTIIAVSLAITLVACNTGDGTIPPQTFPDLPYGKCTTYDVTLESSLYKVPNKREQSVDFENLLGVIINYYEADSESGYKFVTNTQDNPGGEWKRLIPHANDCAIGSTNEYSFVENKNGPLHNRFMIFSSCHPTLESSPNLPKSANPILDFKADYSIIESKEQYNTESPVVLRSGKIHFSCPYLLEDVHGNPLSTK